MRVGAGPLLPGPLPQEVLDGAEGGVGREPVLVLLEEGLVVGIVIGVLEVGQGVLGVLLQKTGVAGEGRQASVRGAVAVGGVDRQDLPVGLAALGQPVHKAAGGGAERAGAALVGKRGHVAEHAHARLKRLLQATLVVEVQDGSAQWPQEGLGAAIHHGGGGAAHHI